MNGVATMVRSAWSRTYDPAFGLTPAWRRNGGLLLLLLAGLCTAYWSTLGNMLDTWWESSTYAHGWLVIPIVAWLTWQARTRLVRLVPVASPWGLLPLFALVGIWLLARAAEVMLIQQLAVACMAVVLVYTLLGGRVVRAMAFPLAYLFFAVPVGEGLVAPLQDFTAWITVAGLRLSGVPVLLEGRHISIPTGDFLVAEACSGIRYLIASLALGCLYAYLSYRSIWRRLAFILLAAALPIIANGLRAYGIVMLAYLSNHRLAVGVDHLLYGWVFFGLVIFLMFWIGTFWRDVPVAQTPEAALDTHPSRNSSRRTALVALLGFGVLVLGPLLAMRMQAASGVAAAPFAPPPAPTGWHGPENADGAWAPHYLGASGQFLASYRNPEGHSVELFGVVYRQQRQGYELIHFDNHLYDEERWAYDGESRHTLSLAPEQTLSIDETRLRSGRNRRRVLWHWYRIGETDTVSPVMAKLLEAWERLRGGTLGSYQFALASDYEFDPEEARQRLRTLLEALASSAIVDPKAP